MRAAFFFFFSWVFLACSVVALPTQERLQKFIIDGTKLPDVDFDVDESYAGLVPISSNAKETRELFNDPTFGDKTLQQEGESIVPF